MEGNAICVNADAMVPLALPNCIGDISCLNGFTVSVWFKSIPNLLYHSERRDGFFLASGAQTKGVKGFILKYSDMLASYQVAVQTDDKVYTVQFQHGGFNNWQHISFTFDSTELKVYGNGAYIGKDCGQLVTTSLQGSPNILIIGGIPEISTSKVKACFDQLAVWDSVVANPDTLASSDCMYEDCYCYCYCYCCC